MRAKKDNKINGAQNDNMIILNVACVTDDKSKGPNTNVPMNVLYGNKVASAGLYNLRDSKLAIKVPKEKVFCKKDYSHISKLPSPFNRPDIIIFHGVYYIDYCFIAGWLRKNHIPYIIVPRCSMTTAAIKSHFLKKKIANILAFNKLIANAKSIQFLTKNEYIESKDNFKFRNYFVLGNGIEPPKKHYIVKKREEFKIAFIGRYNIYHKGLDILLKTVSDHFDWFKENRAILDLYGSDSDNGLKFLSNYIKKNNLEKIVHIKGPVFSEAKEKALIDADIFIHTSRLEGQPTAVIEAISYGVPVIVTPGTNVTDIVKKYDLGFTTEFDSEAIFKCIKMAFVNREKLHDISENEIDYAKGNLGWETIIRRSLDEYKKMLGSNK